MPDQITEQRLTLDATGTVNAAGEFEVIGINVGEAHGWEFTEEALRASLAIWEGVECFVDHSWYGHSVRDLGGVFHSPEWDGAHKGIKLKLRTKGPSGPIVNALGRELLEDGPQPKCGFSADVLFTAVGRKVQTILRALSLDLVYDPARGGKFLRALNSAGYRQEANVPEPISTNAPANGDTAPPAGTTTTQLVTTRPTLRSQIEEDHAAVQVLLSEQTRLQAITEEANAMRAVRAQACAYLLDTGLAASKLPAPMQTHVRAKFTGQVFEPAALNTAIDDARKLVSELTAGALVQGPGRVSAMFDHNDKLQAAVDDMLGAKRDAKLANVKTPRLSGIREMYFMLTGDVDLHGGYWPDRAQLGGLTTDFSGLVKNALNKLVVERWGELGRAGYDWWTKIATVEHFETINQITWIILGTIGTLPVVAEQGEYTELNVGDGPETSSFVKYGGYIPLTLEAIDRDETRKLRAYPRELANAALRNISKEVSDIFTDASAIGPTLADGGALFNSTAIATLGGHLNLLTTALGTTYTAWDAAASAIYNQPMLVKNAAGSYAAGAKQAINPKFCLVPRALTAQANDLFLPRWSSVANVHSENLYKDVVEPITVPEWTDATDWAAVCDPALAPSVMVGERFGIMPEIFVSGSENFGAVFTNDEHRIKVRHFVAVGVADYRPLHKNNVA